MSPLLAKFARPFRLLTGNGEGPAAVLWAPALLIGALLLLSPIYLALRSLGAGPDFWDALLRWRVLEILFRTIILVVAVTAASIALALPLAWLTVRTDLPFARTWSVLLALPLVIPSYVAGFAVIVALGPRGMLQGFLEPLTGLERLPDINGFDGAMLTLTFLSYPYLLLTLRAALQRLDPSLEESSRGLGDSWRKTFWRVVVPLLRPSIAAGGLLVALYTLSDFGAVSLLRYETFTWAIFIQYESAIDRTLGAAFSLTLVLLALAFLLAEYFTRGRSRYYRVDQGVARPAPTVPLGAWRWPAFGLCALVTLLSLVLPLAVLVFWVIRGVAAGEPLLLLWEAAANSLYVSGLAALFAALAAFPIATLSVRYPGPLSSLLERITYVGFALPGIAVALGLVFFGANYARFLYQHLSLLNSGLRHPFPAHRRWRHPCLHPPGQPPRGGRRPWPGPPALAGLHFHYPALGAARRLVRRGPGLPPYYERAAGHPDSAAHRLPHPGYLHLERRLRSLLRPGRRPGPPPGPRLLRPPRLPDAPRTPLRIAIKNPFPSFPFLPLPFLFHRHSDSTVILSEAKNLL